ncbi:MAG: C1 family peptidase [Bacilli bacterium]|nr:C1 family peptidase [Bacilli bacterium]
MKEFENTLTNANPITCEDLARLEENYSSNQSHTILRHALSKTALADVVSSKDDIQDVDFKFSIDIPTMQATNQKSSGRCWIFAACNVLREIIGKKANIKEFEISQSYIAFYDKYEKFNYALESIIDLIDHDPDERVLSHVLNLGIQDGGQWDMFVNIVKKYGICPKNILPETFASSNTGAMNQFINVQIRKFAATAQKYYKEVGIEEVKKYKNELLEKMYNFLCDCYGNPVKEFAFEYVDKDNKYHRDEVFTPNSFFDKFIGSEIDNYVSIIDSPTQDKPYGKTYTIAYLGNVIGGKEITHLNLPINRMKELVISQLKDGEIVWFGSDCGKEGNREDGIWDPNLFDFASAFGMDFSYSKEDALNYHMSVMNHAMCITGVNLVDDAPTKWKIENSWGTDRAKAGYYMMSDEWFDKYVYQAVIHKKYLNNKELKALDGKKIILKPWDPMGSLAD